MRALPDASVVDPRLCSFHARIRRRTLRALATCSLRGCSGRPSPEGCLSLADTALSHIATRSLLVTEDPPAPFSSLVTRHCSLVTEVGHPHRGGKAAEQSRFALLALIRIEEWGQHGEGYVTRCLAENRAAGTCIELAVVRYRQGFPVTARRGTLEFHVTSPLGNNFKSKSVQYPCDLSTREPLKPGQRKPPTQRLR